MELQRKRDEMEWRDRPTCRVINEGTGMHVQHMEHTCEVSLSQALEALGVARWMLLPLLLLPR